MKIAKQAFRVEYKNGYLESGILDNDIIPEDVIYLKIRKTNMKNFILESTTDEAKDIIELLQTAIYEYSLLTRNN